MTNTKELHRVSKRVRDRLKELGNGIRAVRQLFPLESQQTLAGFKISWMPSGLLQEFVSDTSQFEIVLVETQPGLSDIHVHHEGTSLFFTLGTTYGFPEPSTDLLICPFNPSTSTQKLKRVPLLDRGFTLIEPTVVHGFFTPNEGGAFAFAVVSPPIKHGEGDFDLELVKDWIIE